MSDPVRGVIFAHSEMAAGLVSAAHVITGIPEDALVGLSNDIGAPDVLAEELDALCGAGDALVFTDLIGSSCNTMAAVLARQSRGLRVISGVNLPMLIEFAFNRHLPLDMLVERLVLQGRQGIQAQGAPGGG